MFWSLIAVLIACKWTWQTSCISLVHFRMYSLDVWNAFIWDASNVNHFTHIHSPIFLHAIEFSIISRVATTLRWPERSASLLVLRPKHTESPQETHFLTENTKVCTINGCQKRTDWLPKKNWVIVRKIVFFISGDTYTICYWVFFQSDVVYPNTRESLRIRHFMWCEHYISELQS